MKLQKPRQLHYKSHPQKIPHKGLRKPKIVQVYEKRHTLIATSPSGITILPRIAQHILQLGIQV